MVTPLLERMISPMTSNDSSTRVGPTAVSPGNQRFGWSDCTLAGSGEGGCDREGTAADLVVGGPGRVGGPKKWQIAGY